MIKRIRILVDLLNLADTLPNLVSAFRRRSDWTSLVEACAIFIVLIE